jgi:hypothetical protein
MNLEFMCCILYGLSEIYMKPIRKKVSDDTTLTPELCNELTFKHQNSTQLIFSNDEKQK